MKGRGIMEELLKKLLEIRPDVDFKNEKHLVDGEVLDSFDIIAIVSAIDELFGVEVDADDLEPVNFNSVEAMYELILKLKNRG